MRFAPMKSAKPQASLTMVGWDDRLIRNCAHLSNAVRGYAARQDGPRRLAAYAFLGAKTGFAAAFRLPPACRLSCGSPSNVDANESTSASVAAIISMNPQGTQSICSRSHLRLSND